MDFLPLQRKDAPGRGQVAGRSREWTVFRPYLDLLRGPTTIKTEGKKSARGTRGNRTKRGGFSGNGGAGHRTPRTDVG